MLTTIHIKNFRGIKDLALHDLQRINVLVGKNNTGKTSVLEAFFCMGILAAPAQIASLNANIRRFLPQLIEGKLDAQFWGSFLWQFDTKTEATIEIHNKERKNWELKIGVITPSTGVIFTNKGQSVSSPHTELHFHVTHDAKTCDITTKTSIQGTDVVIDSFSEMPLSHPMKSLGFIGPGPNTNFTKTETLKIANKLADVEECLRYIEPSLEKIDTARNTIYCKLQEYSEQIPINFLGDGMQSILKIMIDIVTHKNGIILIDEIETGLHHSVLTNLWKAVINAAEKHNVQLVITTHSKECIDALTALLAQKEPSNKEEIVRLYTLYKEGNDVKAVRYDEEALTISRDLGAEVRS